MSDVLLILCTFPDIERARQIGTVLLERQLVACVNFLPAVESVYRWQGKVETATEVLAIFKTTESGFADLSAVLTELHPYEVPEIIGLSPDRISEPYRSWVVSNVGPQDQ